MLAGSLRSKEKAGPDPDEGGMHSDQSGSPFIRVAGWCLDSEVLPVSRWKILLWSFANFGG